MERERQICFVGCWLFGALVGFVAGLMAALPLYGVYVNFAGLVGSDWPDGSTQGVFLAALSAVLVLAPLGGWGGLATARRFWGTVWAPWLSVAAALGYAGVLATSAALAYAAVIVTRWQC